MKGGSRTLKIIAIVVNGIFLAGLIYGVTMYGVHLRDVHDRVGFIFTLVFPTVTLVATVLTFRREGRECTCVLRVIAVIVNVLFLIIFISAIALKGVNLEYLGQLPVCIMGLGLPVLNVVVLALAFRKEKQTTTN